MFFFSVIMISIRSKKPNSLLCQNEPWQSLLEGKFLQGRLGASFLQRKQAFSSNDIRLLACPNPYQENVSKRLLMFLHLNAYVCLYLDWFFLSFLMQRNVHNGYLQSDDCWNCKCAYSRDEWKDKSRVIQWLKLPSINLPYSLRPKHIFWKDKQVCKIYVERLFQN